MEKKDLLKLSEKLFSAKRYLPVYYGEQIENLVTDIDTNPNEVMNTYYNFIGEALSLLKKKYGIDADLSKLGVAFVVNQVYRVPDDSVIGDEILSREDSAKLIAKSKLNEKHVYLTGPFVTFDIDNQDLDDDYDDVVTVITQDGEKSAFLGQIDNMEGAEYYSINSEIQSRNPNLKFNCSVNINDLINKLKEENISVIGDVDISTLIYDGGDRVFTRPFNFTKEKNDDIDMPIKK